MLYLVAVIFSPLAVLLAGKPFQAILNGVLWLLGVVLTLLFGLGLMLLLVSTLHALFVVHNHYADRRMQRLIDAQRR